MDGLVFCFGIADAVARLFERSAWKIVERRKDLLGIDRATSHGRCLEELLGSGHPLLELARHLAASDERTLSVEIESAESREILQAGQDGLVLGTIFIGVATPTEGGAMGATGAIILGAVKRRLSWDLIRQATEHTVTVGWKPLRVSARAPQTSALARLSARRGEAWRGKRGALLWVLGTGDGKQLAEYKRE